MSDVEEGTFRIILRDKIRGVQSQPTEVSVTVAVLEKFGKEKKTMKKNIHKLTSKMFEWEAEDESGDESVDSFE